MEINRMLYYGVEVAGMQTVKLRLKQRIKRAWKAKSLKVFWIKEIKVMKPFCASTLNVNA